MPTPGLRGTGAFTTDYRPTNYRELFTFLEPNGDAPLMALVAMLESEETDDPKFNNFRDELPTRVLTVDGTGVADTTSSPTLATVADAGWVNVGTIIVNSETGEVMRATANGNTGTGALTVTRNLGGTALTIAAGAKLFIAGHASEEGTTAPDSITFDPTVDYNYTQIFKTPFKITRTLQNTYLRTGSKEDEYTTKALKLHMEDIERAVIFSTRTETTGGGGQKIRTTGGLVNQLSNITDAASGFATANTLTEDEFDRELIENVFAYGSKTKVAYVGAKVAGHMQAIGKNRWQPVQVDDTYGINFTRYRTFAGDLLVYLHPQFRQVPAMDDVMLILDTGFIKYRYLQNSDTQLQENIQANDEDAIKHQFLTECGLELLQDKVHTYLKNWTNLG